MLSSDWEFSNFSSVIGKTNKSNQEDDFVTDSTSDVFYGPKPPSANAGYLWCSNEERFVKHVHASSANNNIANINYSTAKEPGASSSSEKEGESHWIQEVGQTKEESSIKTEALSVESFQDRRGSSRGKKICPPRATVLENCSYADIIACAIDSTPSKKLTLSQIFHWIVTNVPQFRDKGKCLASTGWKVIISETSQPTGLVFIYSVVHEDDVG